ncbi:timeless protein-domain-containing protein [Chytriomyces sp. MP71]|nr:timeless protein-domain-containing protein [Chytriomyces sp. MP71]
MLIVELFVPLTWATCDEYVHSPDQQDVLLSYKDAFLSEQVLQRVMHVLVKSLSIPYRERKEKDSAKIRLILTLFRNLLAIRDPQASAGASSESHFRASLQERVIVSFSAANVLHLILTFAASMDEREFAEYNTLILEMVFLIFQNRTVASLLQSTQVAHTENLLSLAKKEMMAKAARPIATRHARFGGTLSLNIGNGKMVNFFSTATALKSVGSAMDLGKTTGRMVSKKGKQEIPTKNMIRSEEAKMVLKETADAFLEHSFNSLMSSVKDDMDKERHHITDGDFYRFLCVARFFLEYQVEVLKVADEVGREKFDFDTVTDFVNSRSMMFITKRMQIYADEKSWIELQAAMECLKQMLVTLNAMAASTNEEYQEASNNIQNNLYYEAYIIEAICNFCKHYKDQSFSYLKTLVETVHVFLKMLEKFSKSKAFMVVRRKTRQRKTKNSTSFHAVGEAALEIPVVIEVEEPEDDATVERKCVEHEFRFEKIEMDFAYENVVLTYYELLKHYKDLEPRYLHYATTIFHRIFVKCKMEPLLYRLSLLELFNRIVEEERTLEASRELKELKEFMRFVVKKFVAKAKENPLLFVEVLFPKTRGDCRRIIHGADDDMQLDPANDIEDLSIKTDAGKKRPKGLFASDDELEIQKSLTWSEKLCVIVTVLLKDEKLAVLEWLEMTLSSIATKRMFQEEQPYIEILDVDVVEEANEPHIRLELERNNKVHLLLDLLKLTKVITGDADVHWLVPKDRASDSLLDDAKFIRDAIENPVDDDANPLNNLIKKKRKKAHKRPKVDEVEKGDGKEKKERKKTDKQVHSVLSKQFVEDSDDDNDDAFFEAERQRRLKAAELAGSCPTAISKGAKKSEKRERVPSPVKDSNFETAFSPSKESSDEVSDSELLLKGLLKGKRLSKMAKSKKKLAKPASISETGSDDTDALAQKQKRKLGNVLLKEANDSNGDGAGILTRKRSGSRDISVVLADSDDENQAQKAFAHVETLLVKNLLRGAVDVEDDAGDNLGKTFVFEDLDEEVEMPIKDRSGPQNVDDLDAEANVKGSVAHVLTLTEGLEKAAAQRLAEEVISLNTLASSSVTRASTKKNVILDSDSE